MGVIMKLFLSFGFSALLFILFFNSLITVDLTAATVAYWDFEDGTYGTAFSDMQQAVLGPGQWICYMDTVRPMVLLFF